MDEPKGLLARISGAPDSKEAPLVRRTGVPVRAVLRRLAEGATPEAVCGEQAGLEREDVLACLAFAAEVIERSVPAAQPAAGIAAPAPAAPAPPPAMRVTLVAPPPPAAAPEAKPAAPRIELVAPPPTPPPPLREPDPAARDRRNLLIGFAIGAIGIIGGSIPLAGLVWRSESDLLKYAAFAGAALVFFAAGRLVESRFKLALAGRTLLTIFLLLVPLVLIVADELSLEKAGLAISLGIGVPTVLAARSLGRGRGVVFGAAFYLVSAANLLFPLAARTDGARALVGAAVAVGVAGALLELERRREELAPVTATLTLGGIGYALGVLDIRALARLALDPAALATPLFLSCAPALLAAPRLFARDLEPVGACDVRALKVPHQGEGKDGARAAGAVIGSVGALVAASAYVLALASPARTLETAGIGAAALAVFALVRRSPPARGAIPRRRAARASPRSSPRRGSSSRSSHPETAPPHRSPRRSSRARTSR